MNTRTDKRKAERIIAVLLMMSAVGAGALCLNGCAPARPAKPVQMFVGLDTSSGADGQLGGWAYLATRFSARLDARQDTLTLYTVADKTEEFFSTAPESEPAMRDRILGQVNHAPKKRGTYPALFWSKVQQRSVDVPDPCLILLLSDGDNDAGTAESHAAIRAAAEKLANQKNVKAVVLIGVNPENFESLRQDFQPLGKRFILRGKVGPEDLLWLCKLLQEARR
jgi:hypothetical protein